MDADNFRLRLNTLFKPQLSMKVSAIYRLAPVNGTGELLPGTYLLWDDETAEARVRVEVGAPVPVEALLGIVRRSQEDGTGMDALAARELPEVTFHHVGVARAIREVAAEAKAGGGVLDAFPHARIPVRE